MPKEPLHPIRSDQWVRDSHHYLNVGLLLGIKRPELATKLIKYTRLGDFADELNKELGTNIQRGMPLREVWQQVREALAEE